MVGSSLIRLAVVWSAGALVFGMGRVATLGQEACSSSTDGCLAARIRSACQRAAGRQPYRPFDDHFPRFHPVPVSPVFPSLYETASAVGTASAGKPQQPREQSPHWVPYPIPDRLPAMPREVSPSPAPKTGEAPNAVHPPAPRQASRWPSGTSWIFLPAAPPASQDASPPGAGGKVASHAQRVAR